MESIKQILEEWAIDREKVLIDNYHKKGLKASGNFERTLHHTTTENELNIIGQLYTGALVLGRKQNTKQDTESLRKWVGWAGSTFLKDWVQDKGLSLNSYAVAWSIARKGIKVPNQHNDGRLLLDTFTKESVATLMGQISKNYITTIKSDIQESWLK